jgi:RNA binding exosome subunit
LPSDSRIVYVEISVIAHATEDVARVLTAATNVISVDYRDIISFNKSNLTGYHGNPITLLETMVKEQDIVADIVRNLAEGLSSLDKETLTSGIERYVEKGNLYIRLRKQAAFNNSLALDQTDPVRIKIHFKSSSLQQIIDSCKSSGLLL